MKNNTRQINIK